MMVNEVRALAPLLPDTIEGTQKGNPDFRVGGRVMATLWIEEDRLEREGTSKESVEIFD